LYPGDTTGPHLERLNGGDAGLSNPAVESEGIYSGYRFFDKEGITPLFPFGYGLSYTSFSFTGLDLQPAADGGIHAGFTVTNTGDLTGAEVPQVYVGPPDDQPPGIQFAVRQLVQFARVTLAPGQSHRVSVHIAP